MSVKVKRGLGLLVVAFIAWLIAYPASQSSSTIASVVVVIAGLALVGALVGGLVLLAWGLLRD